jgi:hypothetical protein
MASFIWTGAAGTGDFATGGNWSPPGPPGNTDSATINTPGTFISGVGITSFLTFGGVEEIEAQLTGSLAIQVNAELKLRQACVVTTSVLGIGLITASSGTVLVGDDSCIVINGFHPTNSYAILVAQGIGSKGSLRVHGAGAAVNCGGEPIAIGHTVMDISISAVGAPCPPGAAIHSFTPGLLSSVITAAPRAKSRCQAARYWRMERLLLAAWPPACSTSTMRA